MLTCLTVKTKSLDHYRPHSYTEHKWSTPCTHHELEFYWIDAFDPLQQEKILSTLPDFMYPSGGAEGVEGTKKRFKDRKLLWLYARMKTNTGETIQRLVNGFGSPWIYQLSLKGWASWSVPAGPTGFHDRFTRSRETCQSKPTRESCLEWSLAIKQFVFSLGKAWCLSSPTLLWIHCFKLCVT